MKEKSPYIALILRDQNLGAFVAYSILDSSKGSLEAQGYRVATSMNIEDFPQDQIPELDLVIAHVGSEGDGTLEEQAKLSRFSELGITVVTRLGTAESIMDSRFRGLPQYGKIGNDFYMKPEAKIAEAVGYFLTEIEKSS
jgi:hypothetical protein